jgi:hypothetical protein
MTPIRSPVKPDPEQLYWLHPEEVAAAPGSAAQFGTIVRVIPRVSCGSPEEEQPSPEQLYWF